MAEKTLEGKVAIVTGASRGIGRAIAEDLAANGASVVVNYNQSADEAQEVVAAIAESGGRAVAIQADVAEADVDPGLVASHHVADHAGPVVDADEGVGLGHGDRHKSQEHV